MPLLSRRPLIPLTLAAALALSAAALVAQSRAATPQAPAIARVPEPKDVFGFQPGADYKLASHEQIVDVLPQARRRLRSHRRRRHRQERRRPADDPRRSSRARPTSRTARAIKEIARQLALARGVDETEARALAKEGKAIVWIDGGLHATEVAHAQHTPELGWWLVDARKTTRRSACARTPSCCSCRSMNPDGLDIVRDWYKKNLGTPFETTSAAGAVSPLHRPRQQPRLDDVHAGRDEGGGAPALPRVVPADRLQPPPARPVPRAASGDRR